MAGVIAGLSPSLESLKPQIAESLKGNSGAVTTGGRRSRLRSALVAVQIALSLLLVTQMVLLARAQQRFFSYDPGFETEHVLNVTFASVRAGYKPPVSFYEEVNSRVSAIQGVVYTSLASLAPWNGRTSTTVREVDGTPIAMTGDSRDDPARRDVTSAYLSALGIPLIRGRVFTREELSANAPVVPVVISEAMGNDPATSVIDKHHRCHDVPNLFICDGSSLVTSGRGQPTMTIQALAFRAGEHIAHFAKRGEI